MLEARILINFFKYKRKSFLRCATPTLNNKRQLRSSTGDLKVLFFGTDNFSLPSFQALLKANSIEADSSTIGAVTSLKSPSNCVKLFAEKRQIPLYGWPVTADICRKYDLGVVVSFGHLIPENIIQAFPLGMINVHASMLPRWRGAAPIIYAIMNGDRTTGVSIMKIEPKKFDIGDVLAQKEIDIGQHVLLPELYQRLASDGANLLLKVISEYPQSFQKGIKQNNEEATYAPKVVPSITTVDWIEMTSTEIYNRFRALYGFKHLTTKFLGKNVKLVELKLTSRDVKSQSNEPGEPGSFEYIRDTKSLHVTCADGCFVEILQIKPENKPIMSAMDFNNGFCRKHSSTELVFSNT